MSAEAKKGLRLEIAHVLFMDVVGFSKLLINDQSEILEQLNQLVRNTPHFAKPMRADAFESLTVNSAGDLPHSERCFCRPRRVSNAFQSNARETPCGGR